MPDDSLADATKAIHAARNADLPHLAGTPVVEPIVQSANFGLSQAVVDDLRLTGGRRSYSYTRLGNPTTQAAARVIAALEGAESAAVVASGMAAIPPTSCTETRLTCSSASSRIVTVRVAGGDEAAHRVQKALRLIQPATSLGGTESVVCIPAETSHLSLTDDERSALGILPGTLRFSFGLEDRGDLLADLAAALSGLGA